MQSEISLITPAFNEETNLEALYGRICSSLGDTSWEWIIVDDHSSDQTFSVIEKLNSKDSRVSGYRLAHNFGSHAAITCALDGCQGKAAVVLAADLQDPPEVLPKLIEEWKKGAQVVWATRKSRDGESVGTLGFSRLYYALMRKLVGIENMPATGADFFLIDEVVIRALREFKESNKSLFALITWMGFRQTYIPYDKQSRASGQSGWSLRKKIKLLIDSITSFSFFPIRFISTLGVLVAVLGFAYAVFILIATSADERVTGWASLMTVVLVLGGVQLLMIGILGEYVWRSLEESRSRPQYLIESKTESKGT